LRVNTGGIWASVLGLIGLVWAFPLRKKSSRASLDLSLDFLSPPGSTPNDDNIGVDAPAKGVPAVLFTVSIEAVVDKTTLDGSIGAIDGVVSRSVGVDGSTGGCFVVVADDEVVVGTVSMGSWKEKKLLTPSFGPCVVGGTSIIPSEG